MEYIKFFKTFLSRDIDGSSTNHNDDCPLCDARKKFFANIATGLWDCKKCGEQGNANQFIFKLHQRWLAETSKAHYKTLFRERRIRSSTFEWASWAYDESRGKWLVPFFGNKKDELWNLGNFNPELGYKIYKCLPLMPYIPIQLGKKTKTRITSLLPKEISWLEGEWDVLAWHDMEPDILPVGCPGALTFKDEFKDVLAPVESVIIGFDDDDSGSKGVAKSTDRMSDRRRTIRVVDWMLAPSSDEKRDIRQVLIDHGRSKGKEIIHEALVEVSNVSKSSMKLGAGYHSDITAFDRIDTWDQYINEYRNIFYVNKVSELAMLACTAIVLTNHIQGEPLWGFLVGPASSGKTTYLESFGGQNQLFDFVSKLTAKVIVSGWRGDGGEDASLIPKINNKVLIVKDFTTILSESKDEQNALYAIMRDAYDGVIKIPFGNGKIMEYHGVKFNIIAGVTDAIHSRNDSEFGERWFKIDFLGNNYNEMKYIKSAFRQLGNTKRKKEAVTRLTLGFLHSKVRQILDTHAEPFFEGQNISDMDIETGFEIPTKWEDRLASLGQFVARLSAKPRNDRYEGIVYRPRHALPTRVALQLAKLWQGVNWTLDSKYGEKSFNVVRKVAVDTCYGFTYDVVKYLYENSGATRKDLVHDLGIPSTRVHRVLTDLTALKLLHRDGVNNGTGRRGRNKDAVYLEEKLANIFHTIQPPDDKL